MGSVNALLLPQSRFPEFLMKNKNSFLSSPSQTPNAPFFFFFMKAKLLGYFPCNPSNASELLFPLLAAFLLRLSPRVGRSRSCSAVGDCTELVDSSHRASFVSQVQRKEPFIAAASWSGIPWGAPHKVWALWLFPGVCACCLVGWEKETASQVSSLCSPCRLWCSSRGKSLV